VTYWTRRVTLADVNPEHEDTPPINWDATRPDPLGPLAAPVSGPVVPYQPQQEFLPPPSPAPYPTHVYVQPSTRKGITGPQAAVLIAVLVLVLPVLCCLGLAMVGLIGGAGTPTTP